MSDTAARGGSELLERTFMRRLFWVLILGTTWMWVYNERFSHRINAVSVDVLQRLDDLPTGQREAVFNAAFIKLQGPHFFSGIQIPDALVPQTNPLLNGVSTDRVIASFTSGEALRLSPKQRRWVARAKSGRVAPSDLQQLKRDDPIFANTIHLLNPSFSIAELSDEQRRLCQESQHCVRQILQSGHIHHYNALVLLFRWAKGHGFSDETVEFVHRNPGFYIAARVHANTHGFGPVAREGEALLSIRRLQRTSIHSMRTTTFFFTLAIFGLAGVQLLSRKRPQK